MKKTTVAIFGLGLVILLAGVIGLIFESDTNAKAVVNQNVNSISQMDRWDDDSYSGMMGNQNNRFDNDEYTNTDKQDIEILEDQVKDYINKYDKDLEIADVFIYSDTDYYFSIVEQDTGMGAMELLVNPYTGTVYQEYGPNMMWNMKYGMMENQNMMGYDGMMGNESTTDYDGMMGNESTTDYDGMMGNGDTAGYGGMMGNQNITGNHNGSERWCENYDNTNYINEGEIKVNELAFDEAFSKGDEFLSGQSGDYKLSESYHEFYGYFTFHVEKNGESSGMLSVNAFTGDVWFHDWHGELLEIRGSHEEVEH